MKLYRIGATWAGTQLDAKRITRETGEPWVEVDVPTDKAGLIAFLNAGEHDATVAQAAPDRAPPTSTVTDAIMDLSADALAPVLTSAVERLGELATKGHDAVAALVTLYPSRNAFYRGAAIVNQVAAYT